MSGAIFARAPGKLFLLGEYAVLDGCPAVVAAIDRHVEVRLQAEPRGTRVRISCPEYGGAEFSAGHPPEIDGPLRFVIAAYRTVLSRSPEIGRGGGCSLSICGSMTGPGGVKIGLGSSAAVTVATTAALLASTGASVQPHDLFAAALEAHHTAQDGVGSGADVAASVYGGLIRFQPRQPLLPAVTALALPPHTKLLVAWSGESASSAGLVKRYLAGRNGSAARAAFVAATRGCVDSFVNALAQGDVCAAAINENGEALERLGEDLGLPVLTPRLTQLVALARAHGAAAKTSGAGNGDCGIALTRDAIAAARICSAWQVAQLVPLDVALDPTGVTIACD
jgi:phosphomevalonate kinase